MVMRHLALELANTYQLWSARIKHDLTVDTPGHLNDWDESHPLTPVEQKHFDDFI